MLRDLVEQAQRGDADAFEALVRETSGRLYAIAWRILRDADRAEDALQQAFTGMWRDLPALRDAERFEAWACRLVVHASYREARRDRRFATTVRSLRIDPSDAGGVPGVIDRDEVERGFRRLSAEHRAVLVLHHYVGLRIPEIAETLGVPAGTARSRLHYAQQSLRAAFEADERAVAWWRAPA